MEKRFDLTTAQGLTHALRVHKEDAVVFAIAGPFGYLGKKLYDRYRDDVAASIKKAFTSTETIIQEQRNAAVEIIKAGKASGADTIEIVLNQKAGMDIGSTVQGAEVKAMLGKNGHMTLKVKYKDDAAPAAKPGIQLPDPS
jgi:hypothetical protein